MTLEDMKRLLLGMGYRTVTVHWGRPLALGAANELLTSERLFVRSIQNTDCYVVDTIRGINDGEVDAKLEETKQALVAFLHALDVQPHYHQGATLLLSPWPDAWAEKSYL